MAYGIFVAPQNLFLSASFLKMEEVIKEERVFRSMITLVVGWRITKTLLSTQRC